jgi:hypothetical protein
MRSQILLRNRTSSYPFSVLAVILLAARIFNGQDTPSDSDFQFWNETVVAIPVKTSLDEHGKQRDDITLLILGTLRLGQNRMYPVDKRIGFGFDFRINQSLTLTPSYYFRAGEPVRDRPEYEHRARLDLTYDVKWPDVSFRNRNRIEYRIRHSRPDTVRYRNKSTVRFPIKEQGRELFAPFFANEVFYDFREGHWSSNEFSVGISKKIGSFTSTDAFYLLRTNRTGAIRTINGIGLNLKFTIR